MGSKGTERWENRLGILLKTEQQFGQPSLQNKSSVLLARLAGDSKCKPSARWAEAARCWGRAVLPLPGNAPRRAAAPGAAAR